LKINIGKTFPFYFSVYRLERIVYQQLHNVNKNTNGSFMQHPETFGAFCYTIDLATPFVYHYLLFVDSR